MLELVITGVFAGLLLLCVALDVSILYALLLGFLIFFLYGVKKARSVRAVARMAIRGVLTSKNVLLTFFLIGMITAVWRVCGTIPCIVYYAVKFMPPVVFVPATFLICCLVSFLTGTSFGTAATVGVICMTTSASMGIPAILSGGAILSGCYFGDRCSPMSTSALLTAELTKTDIFGNIRVMVKTSIVPFFATVALYFGVGVIFTAEPGSEQLENLFAEHFDLHPVTLLPALIIVALSIFKCRVKLTMTISIAVGCLIAVFLQKTPVSELLLSMVCGFQPKDEALSTLISGGGIVSMLRVFAIVCLSSSFSGIFQGTGFLEPVREKIEAFGEKTMPYAAVLLTSVVTGLVACNQTLTIILTEQLCDGLETEPERMASHIENTAVVIAPLIPWSIAGAAPLASATAPLAAILTAFYLYLVPAWNYVTEARRKKRRICTEAGRMAE